MTAFNAIGSTWTGGNKGLITDVLRNEWNFEGVVITDFRNEQRAYMDLDQMVHAGADIALATVPQPGEPWPELKERDSATTFKAVREACKHSLYATVNSNAMNGIAPGSIISYSLTPWESVLIAANVIVYVLIAGVAVCIVLRGLDSKKHPENYKQKKVK